MTREAAHYSRYEPQRKNAKGAGRTVAIIVAIVVGVILAIYVAGCIYFSGHLLPNTTADKLDLSLMNTAEAEEALSDSVKDRVINVSGQNVNFNLDATSTGLTLNTDDAVNQMMESTSAWQWPWRIFQSHDESSTLASSFDRSAILTSVTNALAAYNSVATDPVDASVAYSDTTGTFIVNPGSTGTKIDPEKVTDLVINALQNDQSYVSITSDSYVQQTVKADDPSLQQAATTANAYLTCSMDLTVNGTVIAQVVPSLVKDWILFDENHNAYLDDTQLANWVDTVEAQIDNVGGTVTYTRPDGKVITVSGGTYGWISNGDELESMVRDAVTSGFVGSKEVPMKQTAAVYNPGGQDWGTRYIDVDLSEQYVRFYGSDGSILLATDCITGDPTTDHATPEGVYYINNKATNQILKGLPDENGNPEYETPVTYWMPFINNLVAFHDAPWQPSFGGNMYISGYGSHGCVNLPSDVAANLYSIIQIGDVVVVHS